MENLRKIKLPSKTVYYTKDGYKDCTYDVYIKNSFKERFFFGKKEYEQIGQFIISRYPNCCGISVLNNVIVNWQLQNKGYGNLIVQLALQLCDTSQLQATTNTHSPKMDHLLLKYGFQVMNNFINHKTGNKISIYYLNKINLSV